MGRIMYFWVKETGDANIPRASRRAENFRCGVQGLIDRPFRSKSARPAPRIPSWFPGNWSRGHRGTRTCLPRAESRGGVCEPGPPFGSANKKARWLQTGRRTIGPSRGGSNVLNEGLSSDSLGSDDIDVHVHGISLGISPYPRLDDLHRRGRNQPGDLRMVSRPFAFSFPFLLIA